MISEVMEEICTVILRLGKPCDMTLGLYLVT